MAVRARDAFKVGDGEDAATATRRIVRGQIDSASEGLASGSDGDLDGAVHDARKRLKRLRAVLKLVHDEVGDRVYRRENAKLRDVGRELSGTRDAKVLVDTLDAISSDGDFASLRAALAADERAAHDGVTSHPETVAALLAELRAARGRVARWPLSRTEAATVLAPGFERVYGSARRAQRAARKDPSDERLHELRKRTKDVWHAAQIVRPIAPKPMGKMVKGAHEIADLLGDDHDLGVLLEAAETHAQLLDDVERKRLAKRVARRRARLQRRALKRARRLYEAKPPRVAAVLVPSRT